MKILAFSGSPIRNGNLEKALREILAGAKEPSELQIRSCTGCLKCASNNRCIQKDDMNGLLDKIEEAPALVIGGFPTFWSLNALTKTFLERLFPLKHNRMLTRGKLGVSVACGFRDTGKVISYLDSFFTWFQMEKAGSLEVPGCMPCLSCGYGEQCAYSNVKKLYGADARIEACMFPSQARQEETWQKARQLGEYLRSRLRTGQG